jgi:hypothetical protein
MWGSEPIYSRMETWSTGDYDEDSCEGRDKMDSNPL